MKPPEDEDLDLLQNIEFRIVEAYHLNPAITDFDVADALDALTRHYTAEQAERQPSAIPLDFRAQDVYKNVKWICEWRLGRGEGSAPDLGQITSLQRVISALRTIKKSVHRWSGHDGKRGYLEFVKDYVQ